MLDFLFGKKKKKKMRTFTGRSSNKMYQVQATTPAGAARKIFKQLPAYRTKGAKVISVKTKKGKTFRYRVSLQRKMAEIAYGKGPFAKLVTYKYRIRTKAIKKGATSPSKKTSTDKKAYKTYCKKCKSGKCKPCNHSRSFKPVSGGGFYV
tara:strand:- start:3303 stop:3752 length:450 start_codon:yes stop_codon:yes gene_type:complete